MENFLVIKVVGFVDENIHVNKELYEAAEAAGALSDFMNPILATLDIDLTFGRESEFDGN